MATAVSVNIAMPRRDMAFVRHLSKKMGWTLSEAKSTDALYDPETGKYLNEETMQAIREAEAGNTTKCKDFRELAAHL